MAKWRYSHFPRLSALGVGVALAVMVAAPAIAAAAEPVAKSQVSPKNVFPGTWAMTAESSQAAVSDCCSLPAANLPLTPEYRKIHDDYVPQDTTNSINNTRHCISSGVPGTLLHPMFFEFLFTAGRVNMIFQDGSFRRIWVDGRSFPKDIEPTLQGYSIGHWEGGKLIVETRGLSNMAELLMGGPIYATDKTRVVEEMSLEKDGRLHIRMTTYEPSVYTRPYTFDAYYQSVPVQFDVGCAVYNRDNGTEADLSVPEE